MQSGNQNSEDLKTTNPVNEQSGLSKVPTIPDVQPTDFFAPPLESSSNTKQFGGKKVIATLLGTMLLVGGLAAGTALVLTPQLLNQKAAPIPVATNTPYVIWGPTPSPVPTNSPSPTPKNLPTDKGY
jgi:hypothetical protein